MTISITRIGAWFVTEFKESNAVWREIWAWARAHNWKASARGMFRLKHWSRWLGLLTIITVAVLFAVFQNKIADYFERHINAIDFFPGSFVFPILLLMILSFPPMIGQELVCLVVGLVWGLASGFFIVAPGTIFGELACFAVFKRFWTEKAKKIEHESVMYGCLVALMRHGNLGIIVTVRMSFLPGHVVTAIQSTVGMSIWVYLLAIVLSLPKQFGLTLLGVGYGLGLMNPSAASGRQQAEISVGVLVSTIVVSAIAFNLVLVRGRRHYPAVAAEFARREAEAGEVVGLQGVTVVSLERVESGDSGVLKDGGWA